jgi:hypothetical protein
VAAESASPPKGDGLSGADLASFLEAEEDPAARGSQKPHQAESVRCRERAQKWREQQARPPL